MTQAHKPFRVHDTPSNGVNGARPETRAPSAGKAIVTSQRTGDPLPPPSSSNALPKSPDIPWHQPALGVDHLPVKGMKRGDGHG